MTRKECLEQAMRIIEEMKGYESLVQVYQDAVIQASKGKGRERHASEGETYENQIICEVARRVGLGYPLGQAVKKIYESQRIGGDRGVAELLGALNYVAAAVIVMREGLEPAPKADAEPEFKYGDRVQFRDEIPSTSEPHWFEGVYVERLSTGGHAVKFGPQGHVIHCSDKEIRPAPKATGCEELVQEEPEPEFNPRDRVQAKMSDGKWRDAFVSGKEIVSGTLHYTVSIHGFDGYYSLPAEDIRPAPRAEGCEDLVQQDAPQTPQELYQHIVDCNPSVYPRTPTGEELAEMAEEEGNG